MSNSAPADFKSSLSPSANRRFETLLIILLLLGSGWIYWGSIPADSRTLSEQPSDYYGLLTEAFRLGQLHLPITPDPKLLELENPYAGPQGANRPHDMSFYNGKLYLYYGATPVLLIYLPWRLLTGTHLNEMVGMVAMLWVGLAAAAAWLTALKRRYCPNVSPLWLLAMISAMAFGVPLLFIAQNPTFYAVPIAGGFCCLMLALVSLNRALADESLSRQAFWLGVTSLAWGLAVGARPIYVLGLPLLGVCAWWLWWQAGHAHRWRWSGVRLLAAAVAPAALIGLVLMTYNYLRFDDPMDFGIRFSLASADIREARLVGPEFIGKNVALYLFSEATVMRYFPFLANGEAPFGVMRYVPWLWLAILLPATWFMVRERDRCWVLGTAVTGGAAVANFLLLSLFFGEMDRYLLDFVPPLYLAACAVGLACVSRIYKFRPTWLRRSALLGLAVLLGIGWFNGTMLGLSRHEDREGVLRVANMLNQPTAMWESWGEEQHGPLRLQVRFPIGRETGVEPLLTSGGINGNGDIVTVTYLPDQRLQLGYFHLGVGGPQSDPVSYTPGAVHEIEVTMGGLYPPPEHPRFRDWNPAEVGRLRRQLRITFDGEILLDGSAASYPSSPGMVRLGENHTIGNVTEPRFTGEILSASSLGIERIDAPFAVTESGPVQLKVILPDLIDGPGLPLVSTGVTGAGDLVSLRITGPGRAVLTHDNWGSPAAISEEFTFLPGATQTITVEMGSLYPPEAKLAHPSLRDRLRLGFNGRTVFDFARPFYPSSLEQVEIGYNAIAGDAVTAAFTGRILAVERVTPAALPEAPAWGAVRLTLRFPRVLPTASEPLLVTGRAGRADVLFVRYGPDRTIQFGFDHWGVGSTLSERISVDTAAVHHIEVRMASLFPRGSEGSSEPTQIFLNGQLVFTPPFEAYSDSTGAITVGRNDIGASSCLALFSGQIMLVERLSE